MQSASEKFANRLPLQIGAGPLVSGVPFSPPRRVLPPHVVEVRANARQLGIGAAAQGLGADGHVGGGDPPAHPRARHGAAHDRGRRPRRDKGAEDDEEEAVAAPRSGKKSNF